MTAPSRRVGFFANLLAPQRRSGHRSRLHDLFTAGTGTPAIFTLKEPRLVRVMMRPWRQGGLSSCFETPP
jgi:hypothetical protein